MAITCIREAMYHVLDLYHTFELIGMQHPEKDITEVVTLLTTAITPGIQKAALERFFAPDAGFIHPVCAVERGPNSRDKVLAIYQWYRVLSPQITLEVKDVVYDREQNVMFLEIVQKFHLRLSPLSAAPSRLITRIKMEERDGLHHIVLQEDFYHPEDFAALIIPPLKPLVSLALRMSSIACSVGAFGAQMIGFWRPESVKTT